MAALVSPCFAGNGTVTRIGRHGQAKDQATAGTGCMRGRAMAAAAARRKRPACNGAWCLVHRPPTLMRSLSHTHAWRGANSSSPPADAARQNRCTSRLKRSVLQKDVRPARPPPPKVVHIRYTCKPLGGSERIAARPPAAAQPQLMRRTQGLAACSRAGEQAPPHEIGAPTP